MLTVFAIRNCSWFSSSETTASIFASSTRHTLCQGRTSEWQTTFDTRTIVLHRGWNYYPCHRGIDHYSVPVSANNVCHRNDRPTKGGGTMILVRRGIDHYSVPVSNLRQVNATNMCINIGGRPVNLVVVYHHYDSWSMQTSRNVLAEGNRSFWLGILTLNIKTRIRDSIRREESS